MAELNDVRERETVLDLGSCDKPKVIAEAARVLRRVHEHASVAVISARAPMGGECCAPEALAECCEATAKADCCGPTKTDAPGNCGCN
jgi:hypothetical protein